jgi:16S rRNA (cytosine967-C5)-methyltransferase
VRLAGSVNPRTLPGFDEGLFFVQDSASAISAEALGTLPGDAVIDVCACPGGKSFAAAILATDSGSVMSFDVHESKLSLISDSALRLGLNNVTADVCDATLPREELFGSFDRVICDVPCSGLGVLAKKPDIRHKNNESLHNLPELQFEILKQSSRYLKDGGCMIYSTCTLNPQENQNVVNRFLEENHEFSLCDFTVADISSDGGMLTLLPHVHSTDGFFIAKLQKEEK